ncbi:AfsR/SARP family transcriptional regulator [Dactylosporangium sp. CA-092794]|uniref:AfsR/SARP family transcriptional regulator n=1 Tax=Dactylosporangium sp. CA-092794 TaxID=3239929 RepID=UPI003D938C19
MPRPEDQHVRLLGPIGVVLHGTAVPVAGVRRKAVLAALALSPGQIISAERLIDIVWSDNVPATAGNTLQQHVSHLRGLFRTRDAIVAAAPGYKLDLAGDATDLRTAERLIARAERIEDPAARAAALRGALDLWHSPALADLQEIDWFGAEAGRIELLRTAAFTALVDARLAMGEHTALAGELQALAPHHPLDEVLHAQLILALYRCGRQADALGVLRQIRERLADDLGVDPGRRLRGLETAMLRQDPALEPHPPAVATAPAVHAPVAPAQLPPAMPHFVGRHGELERLDEALRSHGEPAPVTVAVSGPPGVGKTSLAVVFAHRIAPEFLDGQLYANLRGFSPDTAPAEPADILHGFLEALGIASQGIPETLEARVGMYRSALAGRRVLVLIDNAHDADQVRPLLPGAAGCVAVVTSRNKLTPLVVHEGATAVPVDVLARDTAHTLLAQRLGQKRVVHEPDAVDDIISRCAGLPLALGIVAARAETEPALSLATIAEQMLVETDALDALSGGDERTDVRAVISWSYTALSPQAARLFRSLALHPGTEISAAAAASLAAVPIAQARRQLAELSGANLLTTLHDGRYGFHDLIRAYALEQAHRRDTVTHRTGALHRLLDHYLQTAHAAAELLDAYRDDIPVADPLDGVTAAPLPTHDKALDWLIAEYRAILALVRLGGTEGFDRRAAQVVCTLTEFVERRGLWPEWKPALGTVLRAADRLGDRRAIAYSHRGLARACQWSGDYTDAEIHYRHALDHLTALGDVLGQARVRHSLGRLAELRDELDEALAHTSAGLDLFRQTGDKPGIAKALNGVGWYHCLLGDYREALRCCGEALAILQRLGDRRVEANTWDSLGYAYHRSGDLGQAVDCYQHALALFRDIGDPFHEADVSIHLGDAYAAAADPASARRSWRHAEAILDELRHAGVEEVRRRLGSRPDRGVQGASLRG